MAKDKDIESGARAIAEDFKLPGGRRKAVAKLVRHHLSWFDAAKDRGMAVDDILRLLTRAGATYEDGSSINFETLSNALWRRRNADTVEAPQRDKARAPEKKDAGGRAVKVANSLKPAAKHRPRRPTHPIDDNRAAKPGGGLATDGLPSKKPHARVQSEKAKTSSADVLGFMRRAAAIRRPRGDDD
jgi:hypothetical protein